MIRLIRHATLAKLAEGSTAPTEFLIWKSGENMTDDGVFMFTETSAKLLLEEQANRDRLYSFDFDHLSLDSNRPAESGRAAGWHSLAVRDGDLWAINVEWCADVKAGLEESPPKWRYFSPAFRVNDANEIVSYINCALCINPKTHGLAALAAVSGASETLKPPTKEKEKMDLSQILSLLVGLTVPDEQKDALASVVEALQGMAAAPAAPESEPAVSAAPPVDDVASAAPPAAEPARCADEKMASVLALCMKEIADLKAEKHSREFKEIVSSHGGVSESMLGILKTMPIEQVRKIVAATKLEKAALNERPTQGGEPQTVATAQVLNAFGIVTNSDRPFAEKRDGQIQFNTVRKGEV